MLSESVTQPCSHKAKDGGTSPERRTRLSHELHLNAFENTRAQRGELLTPEQDREPEPDIVPDDDGGGHEE